MSSYKNFQFGWVMVIVFLVVMIFITLGYLEQWGNNPIDVYGYLFFMVLFGFILLNFYGMTVTVDEKHIRIKFGIGLFSKKVALSSVTSAEIIRYHILAGYGIRLLPNGILYNVSGRYGVKLGIEGKKLAVIIGTNDQENLQRVIEEYVNKKPWQT